MFCKHFTILKRKDEKQAYFITSTDTLTYNNLMLYLVI